MINERVRRTIKKVPFPRDFVSCCLASDEIIPLDIQHWSGYSSHDVETLELIANLVRQGALIRIGHNYQKTEPFIALLKEMNRES